MQMEKRKKTIHTYLPEKKTKKQKQNIVESRQKKTQRISNEIESFLIEEMKQKKEFCFENVEFIFSQRFSIEI